MQNCTAVDEALWRQLGLETQCFVAQLLPQLMDLVRNSRRLPLGEEHAIRRGSREFLTASKELGQRSLSMVHRVLCFLNPAVHQNTDAEELTNFNLIIDSIDSILEHVDVSLRSALTGSAAPVEALTAAAPVSEGAARRGGRYPLARSSVPKPQVRWRRLIDNARTEFVPRIRVKHNQAVPLDARIVKAQLRAGLRAAAGEVEAGALSLEGKAQLIAPEGNVLEYENSALPHPYEEELRASHWKDGYFEPKQPECYPRIEDTPLVLVSTANDLQQMIQDIKSTCKGKEIAVDVEHHDLRSYHGFVCLVQISTRQKDYIIDPFDIFEQMHELNVIFSDPDIVKVLHGADRDVLWLQRDFSAYLVNMFDTGLATRALCLQGGFGLANLVLHFCGVKLDKKYQTADWRERPLPPDFIQYARCDTHYLLYCYDCLKNNLLTRTGGQYGRGTAEGGGELRATNDGVLALQSVLDKSTALCRQLYSETPLDAASIAMRMCDRFSSKHRPLDSRQFTILQSLVHWRDRLARSLDESLNFVSPDACLWRIAFAMPVSFSHLRSTCNPLPPMVQQHAEDVIQLVVKCMDHSAASGGDAALPPRVVPDQGQANSGAPLCTAPCEPASGAAPSARPARALLGQTWPSEACSKMRPLVDVTAGRGQHQTSGVLHSVLCALIKPEDPAEEKGTALTEGIRAKLEEIRGALRFASEAPLPDGSGPAKIGFATADAAESERAERPGPRGAELSAGAEVERVELLQPPTVVPGPPPGNDETQVESLQCPALLRVKIGKKKRKHLGTKSLEDMAKVAVTDPYTSLGVAEAGNQPEASQATVGKRKKRKRPALEQTRIDPYL